MVLLLQECSQVSKRRTIFLSITQARISHFVHHDMVPLAPSKITALCFGARSWLRETEHRHRQVRKAAAVCIQLLHALLHLVQLHCNCARHERRCCRDGGNDLSRDFLNRVAVRRGDSITTLHRGKLELLLGTKIGASSNEINVMIGVIVLLKLHRACLHPFHQSHQRHPLLERTAWRQLTRQLRNNFHRVRGVYVECNKQQTLGSRGAKGGKVICFTTLHVILFCRAHSITCWRSSSAGMPRDVA